MRTPNGDQQALLRAGMHRDLDAVLAAVDLASEDVAARGFGPGHGFDAERTGGAAFRFKDEHGVEVTVAATSVEVAATKADFAGPCCAGWKRPSPR